MQIIDARPGLSMKGSEVFIFSRATQQIFIFLFFFTTPDLHLAYRL